MDTIRNNASTFYKTDATKDFQIRADDYETKSRWVKDEEINQIACSLLAGKKTLGDLLDAGGGTCFLPFILSQKFLISSITIVDASQHMLLKYKERLPQAKRVHSSIEEFCLNNRQPYAFL